MTYIYIILSAFVVLSYVYDYRGVRQMRFFWMVIMWLVLVGIAGLRYRLGVDSVAYEYEYPDLPDLSQLEYFKFDQTRYQPLYIVFTAICKSISADFVLFQLAHALVVNTVFFWFFNKFTKHSFTALTLYFLILYFPLNMEVMRESLAVSMFLLAWPMFKQGKWLWYYAFCLVALGFHLSAIITFIFPLFWFPWLRQFFILGKRTVLILVILFAGGIAIASQFFDMLGLLSESDAFADRVQNYKDSKLGGMALNINGMLGYFFRYGLYPLMALYFLKKSNKGRVHNKTEKLEMAKEEYMTMWNIYITCFALLITIFHRYNNYLAPFTFLMIADWAFSNISLHGRRVRFKYYAWVIVLLPLFFMQIYSLFYVSLNQSGTLKQGYIYAPYSSRLNPVEDENRERAYRYLNPWRKF